VDNGFIKETHVIDHAIEGLAGGPGCDGAERQKGSAVQRACGTVVLGACFAVQDQGYLARVTVALEGNVVPLAVIDRIR
jgi:hypothetical protein